MPDPDTQPTRSVRIELPKENLIDRISSDYIHSTIFKVVALIIGIPTCCALSLFGTAMIMLVLGMGGTVAAIIAMIGALFHGTSSLPTPYYFIPTETTYYAAELPTDTPEIFYSEGFPEITTMPLIWISHSLDLYGYSIDLPEGWSLEETNRQAEPHNYWNPSTPPLGHDCADYVALSPDGQQKIILTMPCPAIVLTQQRPCSDGAIILFDFGDGTYLVVEKSFLLSRFEDNVYAYQLAEGTATNLLCTYETFTGSDFYLYVYYNNASDFDVAKNIMWSFLSPMAGYDQ